MVKDVVSKAKRETQPRAACSPRLGVSCPRALSRLEQGTMRRKGGDDSMKQKRRL